ncbi:MULTISPECIES: restriction endonuclease subunit S [Streptomyces]|uniref:Type-1 restriction enzyme EcoKI specificity protein n=1 Tax=Streptomyces fradiae ATCC 10745 = DSM 40063 TaxID=1319510 RepID=A0A1Y2NP40_STRFR|nr:MULTISPECIES: restriction endonuclease subunit S [Streptomyces]OSY49263.1 Type-1 restriction enzyme EcoKI specificity protein [Streptomyces fradiae ATCC 10745 = DSM 40063]QEV12336.1 restriction endonuclease subunit S [Streptomyces fradiae ATCC 10745 = DSM 40063]
MSTDAEIRWVPVREVGEVRMGKQLSPSSREAAGQHPYLRVANVYEGRIDLSDVKTMGFSSAEREVYGLRPGDVLLNEGQENLRMVGRSAIYTGEPGAFCFQNTLIRFRPGGEVLPEYAQAVFVRWRAQGVFASIAEKTSISHLGGNRFGSLLFPLRTLSEQRRIVEVIDAVAAQERALLTSIAKLRSARQGTLLSAMSPLQLGEPPKGWVRVPLKEVVPVAEYGVSEALNRDARGVPILRMNNLEGGRLELSDLRYSPTPVPAKLELKYRDVLFNRTNSIDHIGKSAIWRGELPRASFASYLVRINPDTSQLSAEYLVEWLMHPVIRQRVRSISTVAVQQVNVNPTKLRELEIDFPSSLGEQQQLIDLLRSCDRLIDVEVSELSKLREVKLGVIGNLLSGAVDSTPVLP